jgi:DtxR family Mn-dependent transcriptional regulator
MLNQPAIVSKVGDQTSELLELLKHMHIGIGTKLEIKKKFEFDHSLEIKIRQQPPFTISEQLAENIFVQVI